MVYGLGLLYDENGHALLNSSKFSFAFGHLEHSFNDVILPLVVVIIVIIIIYNTSPGYIFICTI